MWGVARTAYREEKKSCVLARFLFVSCMHERGEEGRKKREREQEREQERERRGRRDQRVCVEGEEEESCQRTDGCGTRGTRCGLWESKMCPCVNVSNVGMWECGCCLSVCLVVAVAVDPARLCMHGISWVISWVYQYIMGISVTAWH